MGGKGKGGLPDRWLPYTPIGSLIPGTRFVACKVPLKDALLRNLPAKDRFGPKDLVKAFPNIGLLVDLTNTDRYYDKQEFTNQNIQYEKIHCPGQVIPPNSIVNKFFVIVDKFLDKNNDSDSVIVVHCTHGVNRTGYFISRYMIEKMEIPPDEAVDRVQQARGHKIERNNYVRDLTQGCKGGSEADLRFVPKSRDKIQSYNYRYGREPSLTKTYSHKFRTGRPLWASKGRMHNEPEGRTAIDNWRVRDDGRDPPVERRDDTFHEYDHHGPREYPVNRPPGTPLLKDTYSHWQPHPDHRGHPPDLSWAKESRYRKPSQNQLYFCPRQGSQEHISDQQLPPPCREQRRYPHQQSMSQQRRIPDKAVSTTYKMTDQLHFGKQDCSSDRVHPEHKVPYGTPSVLQQAGPHSFNSRHSSSWTPQPSFARCDQFSIHPY